MSESLQKIKHFILERTSEINDCYKCHQHIQVQKINRITDLITQRQLPLALADVSGNLFLCIYRNVHIGFCVNENHTDHNVLQHALFPPYLLDIIAYIFIDTDLHYNLTTL